MYWYEEKKAPESIILIWLTACLQLDTCKVFASLLIDIRLERQEPLQYHD